MSTNIRISFEDGDRAELALGALRRAGIACRASEPEVSRKSGAAAPKTETAGEKKAGGDWICSICHYKYDGDIPFEELPDDW